MPTSQCNGADLYYEDHGSGRPIVFLHGAWAGIRFFQQQLTDLSAEHRTIAFDFRGHGRSEKTDGGHTVRVYARDLRAFLDNLSLDDVVLVGWSLGALVAWEYVDQFGTDRIGALVNVDMEASPARWDENGDGRYDADRLREIHGNVQEDHWEFVERTQVQLCKEPPSKTVRTMMFDETTRCPPAIKSAIILDATLQDYRDTLPEIDVPTLVCAGADEKWRTVAVVEDTAERIPRARFERFENSGHCLFIEEAERFNRLLGEFVDSV